MNAEYWLDLATEKIRFLPDRKAVRQELQDHLEDRMEAGKAKGLSPYEAEEAATAAMGTPLPWRRNWQGSTAPGGAGSGG